LLIMNVTDVVAAEYFAVLAAVAMTVQVPFCPTTTTRSPRKCQEDVPGEPIEYVMAPSPEVVA